MKNIKLKNTLKVDAGLLTGRTIEFKPYLIGDIPPSFNKHTDVYFNKAGITYIEKKESFYDFL